MRLTLVLLFCIATAQAMVLDYDDESETGGSEDPEAEAGEIQTDPRGHRPETQGIYTGRRDPGVSYRGRQTFRPTPATYRAAVPEAKIRQEQGGCKHLNEDWGVLCPNGCELRTSLLKTEQDMNPTIENFKLKVSNLTRFTNAIHLYVDRVDHEMQQKQAQFTGNNGIVDSYNSELEDRFSLIKEKVERTLPLNIRLMRSLVESFKMKLQTLERALLTQKEYCKRPCTVTCNIPVVSGKECNSIYEKGGRTSQLYLIQPDLHKAPYKVYCDMTTEEGGWTLIQNRQDGSIDFGRSWDVYKNGFGNIAFDVGKGFCDTPGEYWLGNDRISYLTKLKDTELLFEMHDWENNALKAHYNKFTVQNEVNKYRMSVEGYFGTAGNTLMEGAKMLHGDNRTMTIHQHMKFSTYDRDNDAWEPGDSTKQCAREDGGGWWYNRCHSSNPNGRYYWGGEYTKEAAKHGTDDGIVWMNWKGSWYSMKKMSMKIRPVFSPIPGQGAEQIPQSFLDKS
ncbi:fibrinogen beta chain isoform X1 [Cetorhinus maximus]